MTTISLVFLIITISTCVYFNTQSHRRKEINHKPKSVIGEIDEAQKIKDSMQRWESVRKVNKAVRNTKQWKGDVNPRKKRRTMFRYDRQKENVNEGRYSQTDDIAMPNKKNAREQEGRYIEKNTTENNKWTSFDNHQVYKASTEVQSNKKVKHIRTLSNDPQKMYKVARNCKSRKSVINKKTSRDVESSPTHTIKTVSRKKKPDTQQRENYKVDRTVHINTPVTIEGTSGGLQRREVNKMGRYSLSDMAVINTKRTGTNQQKRNLKLKEDRHNLRNIRPPMDSRKGGIYKMDRHVSNDNKQINNKQISSKHMIRFRRAMNEISPNMFPFGEYDYYKDAPPHHHALQKRDNAGMNRMEQERGNLRIGIKEGDDEQNEIGHETCSFWESDIERNCRSLFKCCHNENKTNPNCYCDELCPLFDDCCHDANKTNVVLPKPYKILMPRIHCAFMKRADTTDWCQVVESCPKTNNKSYIFEKCENSISELGRDPLLSIPVTDPLQVTYKNVFCALCNGIHDVRFWKMKYKTRVFQNKTMSNFYDYDWKNFPFPIFLITVFPPDDLSVRLCHGYAVKYTEDELGNGSIPFQCTTLQQFLYESFLNVKGCLTAAWEYEYCYPDHVTYTNCSTCEPHEFSSDVARWASRSMFVLFTFNMENNNCDNSYKLAVTEEEDSLYICPTSTLLNPSYDLSYYIRIEGNVSDDTFDFIGTALFSYASALTDSEINLRYNQRFVYQPTECDIQLIRMKLIYLTQTDQNHWIKLTELYDSLNWTFTELHPRGKVVVSMAPYTSIQNYTLCDFNTSRFKISTAFIKENSAIFQYLPRAQRFCRDVHFSLGINDSDASVSEKLNELRVSESDCAIDVQNSQDIFDDLMTIVSNTLMGIGCMTLVCSLVSTVILKADESIPGLITRHMMITTLLFQIFFIFGIGATDNYVVCFAFGVALHYCTLCVFAWMSICNGYLAKTLMKIKKLPGNTHDRDRKTRYLLICFGYTLPTFVVIPSVIIDTCQCISLSIDYGYGICFPNPSSYPEGMFVFIGPISVHILFNIVCLIVSIHELSRAKVNVAVLSISRSYTPIYLKLCVYSGIGWVFGIATLMFPFDVIKLLFIVSCSSQGLFLSVITLCNLQVLNRLRSQLSSSNKDN